MVHKNFRRQRRLESRLDETVRVASIIQKGMATGRSSYVEMRALDRLTKHNIKIKVESLKKSLRPGTELESLKGEILEVVSEGYTKVLTPNGIVRKCELDSLLSIDADIVGCLGMFKSEKTRPDASETLKELVEERKKLVESLKA